MVSWGFELGLGSDVLLALSRPHGESSRHGLARLLGLWVILSEIQG